MPADRSLLSSTAQGSKPSTPMRPPLRRSGSSVSVAPLASSSTVGSTIVGQQAADAHVEPGQAQDRHQLGDVLQVELVAGVVLGDQQQLAGVRADALDRRLRRLHAQRHEGVVEVVEAAREQVEVDRRELEAGVAQVGRAVEGWHVVLPLVTKPALDLGGVVEELALELQQGAGKRGGEVRNHECLSREGGATRRAAAKALAGMLHHGERLANAPA
jgi:hypothetical protein